MKMTLQNKLLLLLFGLSYTVGLSAQTLKGDIFNSEDSLPIMFANIALVDSSDNILTGTSTNEKGEFMVQVPHSARSIRISQLPEFAELHIIKLKAFSDTLDLGQLPMIKAPTYLQVQFEDISKRQERRKQKKIIKDYNKEMLSYKHIVIEVNKQPVNLAVKPIREPDSERLNVIYILDFEEISKKVRAEE